MTEKTPSEIARETLRLLTSRKLAPNPANFQAVYSEVSGTPAVLPFPDDSLRQIARALTARNTGQQKQKALLESAIAQRNWAGVRNALVAYADVGVVTPVSSASEIGSRTSSRSASCSSALLVTCLSSWRAKPADWLGAV